MTTKTTPEQYTWTIQVTAHADLVAYSFDLSDPDTVFHKLALAFPFARMSHIGVEVIVAPCPESIRKEQGYKDNCNACAGVRVMPKNAGPHATLSDTIPAKHTCGRE